jgi:hypothetical protein
MAIRLCGHISRANYDRIRLSFRHQLRLFTLWKLQKRVAALSGISPEVYDWCSQNCMAFTGRWEQDTHCRRCRRARYNMDGKPVAQFDFIPVANRLNALFQDRDLAKLMRYRHEYQSQEGVREDIFDSDGYNKLCRQNIIINGQDTGRKFFEGRRDVALSFLGDGVQIFEHGHKASDTCWPMILQNLNLPPSERCKLRNVIPIMVIPGPQQPKDFNSFLYPFVQEMLKLAGPGVNCYDAYRKEYFTLRAFPILVCGDMQAIKHFSGMKGPNSKLPCRACRITGVYDPTRKSYYVPLTQPFDPGDPPDDILSYDPENLPLRTADGIKRQTKEIYTARTKTAHNQLATDYGITHATILDRIPSLQRPDSYPHEFMHLFLINHGPNLVSLWTGKYDGINDPGSENYLISARDWAEIGRETYSASRIIPSAFTRPLPNIATDRKLYNAEAWSFWFQYIGPVVLRGRLAQKYYAHYLEFVHILKALLALTITVEKIEQLQEQVVGYVQRFEECVTLSPIDIICSHFD